MWFWQLCDYGRCGCYQRIRNGLSRMPCSPVLETSAFDFGVYVPRVYRIVLERKKINGNYEQHSTFFFCSQPLAKSIFSRGRVSTLPLIMVGRVKMDRNKQDMNAPSPNIVLFNEDLSFSIFNTATCFCSSLTSE